ncbi:MAG: asparagine synthase (glutamine-hydrolyzing) [Bryobacteraceae bacterium]
MCGINGILHHDPSRPVEARVIERMRAAQVHRGPDDSGAWIHQNVGFGFNRLSIIDLSGGHQPMLSEDGAICLVFNGEIYNFQELRAELSQQGHRFRTKSDTEVILCAWQQWGEQCVTKLRGMFAFVLWDERQRILFGARDRFGIKPLYYWAGEQSFAFASELKSLLEFPDVPRKLDGTALEQFLRHRYVLAPRTILEGVRKIPPAHSFVVANGRFRLQRYWSLPEGPARKVSERDAVEEFRHLTDETMRLHLISDVPLGAFLSGGLDSSAVVAWMKRIGTADIKTFTVGYDSPESELPYAKRVAEHVGTDHHALVLTPERFRDLLPKIVWHMDEPVGDEASLPLYFLSEFAKSKVSVVLSGEGSDEIFLGYEAYPWHTEISKRNAIPGLPLAARLAYALFPNRFQSLRTVLGVPLETRYQGLGQVFRTTELPEVFDPPGDFDRSISALYDACKRKEAAERMSFVDMNSWLPDDLLVKADRMTMAASLELRVPFLDHRIVEFAWQLPLSLKMDGYNVKHILKRSVADMLPQEIIQREKMGFPVPLKSWFREELTSYAQETLLSQGGVTDFLKRDGLRSVCEAHQTQDRSRHIYALLVLDQWCRHFLHPAQSVK